MKVLANLVIGLAIIFILICLYILILPETLISIDSKLDRGSNSMAYLSMLFSAIATLIAAFAFRKTTSQPKLQLKIYSWMAQVEGPILEVDNNNKVPLTRPLTSWRLYLSNSGEISAKNPIVKIIFNNAYFKEDTFPGWKAVDHDNAFGWYGFQWTPKSEESQVVHVNFEYQLPPMYFCESYINENSSIEILIAADELETTTLERPILFGYEY